MGPLAPSPAAGLTTRGGFMGEKAWPESLPDAARHRPRNSGLAFLGRDLNCEDTQHRA